MNFKNQGINKPNKGGVCMKRLHKFLKFSVVLLFAIIFLASCSKNNAEKAGSYNDPKEIDLDGFINYFPSKVLEENSDEFKTTLEKLKKLDSFSEFELSAKLMPLVEIDKNLVDATLKKYAGIVSDDVKSKDKCLYLKENNAYYTFVSDVAIGTFYPTEGEIKGNDLVLKNNYATLTLENKDGNYFIKSYIEK